MAGSPSIRTTARRHDAAVIGFALTVTLLLVGAALGSYNAWRIARHHEWVSHTHQVIANLEALLSTLKDAETGQRGYLLTGDENYLEPHDDAIRRVRNELAALQQLTRDNSEQQRRLAALGDKVDVRLAELRQTIDLMLTGDREAALAIVRSDRGKTLMDEVRAAVSASQQVERGLLKQRAAESRISFRGSLLSILLTSIIGLALVGAVFLLSQRISRQRQQAAAVLQEQKERLRVTLASIGDGVLTTDERGRVTFLNTVAEFLTGWTCDEATGQHFNAVFRIVNEETRAPVENPIAKVLALGTIVGLANHTVHRPHRHRPSDRRQRRADPRRIRSAHRRRAGVPRRDREPRVRAHPAPQRSAQDRDARYGA